MRTLIQRSRGPVSIEIEKGKEVLTQSFDGIGLVVLLGWMQSDLTHENLDEAENWILSRILGLRIFEDTAGKMNLSLADFAAQNKLSSGILWVSQFTLAAELDSGFRPSFIKAMSPVLAKKRFEDFRKKILAAPGPHTHLFGEFGGMMNLKFSNWGPVTVLLEK